MIRAALAASILGLTPAAAAAADGPVPDTLEARAAMGEELRELFRIEPDLVAPAVGPAPALLNEIAQGLYAEEAANDLDRIAAESESLFSTDWPALGREDAVPEIVLFVEADCDTCAAARADLDALAGKMGVRANLIDVSGDAEARAMLERLTFDMMPAYVTRSKLIRGHMPSMVLESYLNE